MVRAILTTCLLVLTGCPGADWMVPGNSSFDTAWGTCTYPVRDWRGEVCPAKPCGGDDDTRPQCVEARDHERRRRYEEWLRSPEAQRIIRETQEADEARDRQFR